MKCECSNLYDSSKLAFSNIILRDLKFDLELEIYLDIEIYLDLDLRLDLDRELELYLDLEFLVEFKGLELDLESGGLDLDCS